MATALIGYTGFVGSNLLQQADFSRTFNSKNINEIRGQSFDLVVFAGARAEKWKANQDPEADQQHINDLIDILKTVSAKDFILISTVDVYPRPNDVDEDSPIKSDEATVYGRHRKQLEEFCTTQFNATIIRLPGLFGTGLKKNIIFDFLHNNNVSQIDSDSSFQFYFLDHIWNDIQGVCKAGHKLVNFATEPVTVGEVAQICLGERFANHPEGGSPASYDFRTRYAESLGGSNGYLYSKQQVLKDLAQFVGREQS